MKKSLDRMVAKLSESDLGKFQGGFGFIKGGYSLVVVNTNSGTCDNSQICMSQNSGTCTNTGDCTGTSNQAGSCSNKNACFI